MKRIISRLFLALFAAGLVGGTLFLDEKLIAASAKPVVESVVVTEKGQGAKFQAQDGAFIVEAGTGAPMTLVFAGNALARLEKGSVGTLSVSGADANQRKATFELISGRIWVNTLASTLEFEIKTPIIIVSAASGIFDVEYRDSRPSHSEAKQLMSPKGESFLTLRAIQHDLEVEFLSNRLVIPEGRQMTLSESKIQGASETISKLRYSKLLKEFPFNEGDEPDAWMKQNSEADARFFELYRKKVFDEIRNGGPKMGSDDESFFFQFNKLIERANVTLTFDLSKKEKKLISQLTDHFDAGVYALQIGKEELAKKRFSQFSALVMKLDPALRESSIFQKTLEDRLNRFAFVSPRETFFEAKSTIRNAMKVSSLRQLQTAFNDILDLASSGVDSETNEKVVTALRRYGSAANAHVRRIRDKNATEDVFFQSVVLNDFLSRNPYLLREEFLKISELFESSHLELIASREEADDQRQFFIAEKLRAIQMIKVLIEREAISFQDARRSVILLANQIDALKPTFSDAAVLTYFEDQLTALRPFITYLRSSQADRVRGSFQASDFEEFQSRQDEIREVSDLLSAASGGEQISASRREELAGIVASDFGPLDISNIKIILPESEDDSRVKVVSAELEGKPFTATYDTARKVLSDLVTGEEKIQNAIRLENFKKFFLIKLGKLVLPTGQTVESLTEAQSPQSILEKVSKAKLLEELTQLNITVEEKYLGLENLNDGVIHVRLALLGEGSDAKVFSFDVAQKASVVSNLKVQTVSGEIPVNDTFALRELPVKIEQIYERAAFEKQKEEELKKFVEEEE